jgi:hypothetical protein
MEVVKIRMDKAECRASLPHTTLKFMRILLEIVSNFSRFWALSITCRNFK